MYKAIYFIFVTVISFEYLTIFFALLVATFFEISNQWIISNISLADDRMKYLSFVPLAISIWVFKELRLLLFPNEKANKVLHKWEHYWELKMHFYVSLLYASIFSIGALIPWFIKGKENLFYMLLLLLTTIIGSIILAFSVYKARIDLDEIVEDMKGL